MSTLPPIDDSQRFEDELRRLTPASHVDEAAVAFESGCRRGRQLERRRSRQQVVGVLTAAALMAVVAVTWSWREVRMARHRSANRSANQPQPLPQAGDLAAVPAPAPAAGIDTPVAAEPRVLMLSNLRPPQPSEIHDLLPVVAPLSARPADSQWQRLFPEFPEGI